MKNKFRIVSTMCILILFTVEGVLGSYNLTILTNHNENIEEDMERTKEGGNCDFYNMEQNKEPVLGETPVQTPVPLSAPQPSSGIGIVAIIAILLAIYIIEKKR